MHRLKTELDKFKAQFQDQEKQTIAAKNQMHALKIDNKSQSSKLEALGTEKDEAESRLATAQQLENTEITNLKDQLQNLKEELQLSKQQNECLEKQCTNTNNDARDLRASNDQLGAEVSEHCSTIATLSGESASWRQEADRMKKCLEAAQKENIDLRKEQEDLQCKLEQVGATETKLHNAQVTFSNEQGYLQQQLAALQDEKKKLQGEKIDLQTNLDAAQKLNENYSGRITDLTNSLEEAKQSALGSGRKDTDVEVSLSSEEYEKAQNWGKPPNEVNEMFAPLQRSVTGASLHHSKSPATGNYGHTIHHEELSALRQIKSYDKQHDIITAPSKVHVFGTPSRRMGDRDSSLISFAEEDAGHAKARDSFEEYSTDVIDPTTEFFDDTQDTMVRSMFLQSLEEDLTQEAHCGQGNDASTSTDLSSISSEELTHMQKAVHRSSTPMSCGQSRESPVFKSGTMKPQKSPLRLESVPMSRSQDRPRSQANTASRLMPPSGQDSNSSKHDSQNHANRNKADTQHVMSEEPLRTLGSDRSSNMGSSNSGSSSSDFMHHSSMLKLTYNNDGCNQNEYDQNLFKDPELDIVGKRKRSVDQPEPGAMHKKPRTHFHAHSSNEGNITTDVVPSSSKLLEKCPAPKGMLDSSQVPHSSSEVAHSKSQARSSYNRARKHDQVSSPSGNRGYHKHNLPAFQSQATSSKRDATSRLTRSKSKSGLLVNSQHCKD